MNSSPRMRVISDEEQQAAEAVDSAMQEMTGAAIAPEPVQQPTERRSAKAMRINACETFSTIVELVRAAKAVSAGKIATAKAECDRIIAEEQAEMKELDELFTAVDPALSKLSQAAV